MLEIVYLYKKNLKRKRIVAWIVKSEYEDKIIGDINSFDSDALKVFAEENPEFINKYFIEQ